MIRTAKNGASGPAPGRRLWRAWMALIAILVQTILPDFAMAARVGRAQTDPTLALHALVTVEQSRAVAGCGAIWEDPNGSDQPTGAREHGGPCAFCLALSAHALPPDDAAGTAAFARFQRVGVLDGRGVARSALFRPRHAPRAPPTA